MTNRLSALSTDRALLSRNIIVLFLALISVKSLTKPQGLVRLEILDKLKKLIHLIGSRTRDLPAS
jgi:hypothetical protein